jgi:hypothetical protein
MNKKIILFVSALIAILAVTASGAGLLWKDLYKNETQSGTSQLVGNDLVTLILCVPLLILSAYFAAKGSLRCRLIWTGTLFYFLYVYAMMSFMAAYNQLFLVYVAVYSLSLFSFAASLLTLDVNKVKDSLKDAPIRLTAYFMLFIGTALLLMWLGIILPPLASSQSPAVLETYTTLVVQALDLGIVVPLAILTGVVLLRKNVWGYTLASIVLIKVSTLGTAVLSMALFMVLNEVEVETPQVILFILMLACSLMITVVFYRKMRLGCGVSN